MAAATSVRRSRIAFNVLVLVSSALLLYVSWPFRAPLFLAIVLAAVLQRPLGALTRWLHGRRRTASALLTVSVLLFIAVPLASLAAFVAQQAVVGLSYVRDNLGVSSVSQLKEGALPPRAQRALDRGLAAVHLTREQAQTTVAQLSERARALAPAVVAESGRAGFHTLLMLVALYFLLLDGQRLIRWLWSVSPLQARHTEELMDEFRNVSNASVIGTLVSAVFQGALTGVGFLLTGVPHAIFFGLVAAIASFIPVVGTAIVWVPAVALLILSGHTGAGIGLLAFCLVAVVGAEHVGKPLLLGKIQEGEMHTGLVFLALLGGIEVFGLLGIILGPLVFAFFLALMRMYQRDYLRSAAVH